MSHPDQVPLYPCYRTECDWPDVPCPPCATAWKGSQKKVPWSQYLQGYDHGLREGETSMARVFWQGVCEKKAQKKEKKAAESLRRAKGTWGLHDDCERDLYAELAAQRLAEAAQLRAWAVDSEE